MSDYKHKKKFGQNFLTNQSDVLAKIIEVSDVGPEDVVVEIGPGEGALTELLLGRAKKVYCFEIDTDLEKILRKKYEGHAKFNLIMGDVLEADLKTILDSHENVKVVANIPYYITSPIINKLLECRDRIKEIYIMVQKEVAERICSKSGKERSVLTLAVEYFGDAQYLFTIPKEFFTPAPKVDSAFMSIKVHQSGYENVVDEKLFFKYVKASFANKRKNILNNLTTLGYSKDELRVFLKELDIPEGERAENITIDKFVKMVELFEKKGGKN
ncbi:MAG: 16S rRNA (adenine(1518)-N(6)/adenine(1519)-N(6))-dimethyltransferase RsmA [Fusobacteriaceae bacterium]